MMEEISQNSPISLEAKCWVTCYIIGELTTFPGLFCQSSENRLPKSADYDT